MTILIIEDEEPAYRRLQKMLKEIEPDHNLLPQIVSVSSAVKFLRRMRHRISSFLTYSYQMALVSKFLNR